MSNQKPRTIEEQIRLLRSRGMQFSNEEYAKKSLSHISYFRLRHGDDSDGYKAPRLLADVSADIFSFLRMQLFRAFGSID